MNDTAGSVPLTAEDYADLKAIRQATTDTNMIVVEGV